MPARRRPVLAVLVVVAALAAGCGDDGAGGAEGADEATTTTGEAGTADGTTTTGDTTPADLPPLEAYDVEDITELQAVFGPPLAELDLLVTRGGVVQFRGGDHLQLYAEPTTSEEENPPEVFLERMLTSFQAVLPLLFDAYPELDSFDLCQEPVPEPGTPPTEPGYEEPTTLLLVTRQGYESVDDWSTATLADLLSVAGEEIDDLGYAEVAPEVAALPAYQEARAG